MSTGERIGYKTEKNGFLAWVCGYTYVHVCVCVCARWMEWGLLSYMSCSSCLPCKPVGYAFSHRPTVPRKLRRPDNLEMRVYGETQGWGGLFCLFLFPYPYLLSHLQSSIPSRTLAIWNMLTLRWPTVLWEYKHLTLGGSVSLSVNVRTSLTGGVAFADTNTHTSHLPVLLPTVPSKAKLIPSLGDHPVLPSAW